ncbi:MAG: tetratricopeptide repeat protein [Chloroflexi bacterium]|nr:tetratricopeptide repeat protein [Chloroflexota bacterium]
MLEIRFLGPPEFRRDGQTLLPLATRKTQSLLAYLIFHRDHTHSRDELATLFWGDRDDVRARRSLTTALWCIRRLLGEDYLFADPTSVQFNPASDFWLDVAEFEEQVNKYKVNKYTGKQVNKYTDLSTAVDIYRGDFMEGFYDDWCIEARYHLEAVYLDALTRLIARCEAQRNFTLVLTYTQKYLAHDALAENIHFAAMRALVALGNVAGAQRQWQFCCEVRQQELHTPPSPEMLEQAQSILGAHFRLPLPVEILQPLTPSRRGSLERPPFVGRTRELNVLLARWEEAIRGKSGLVLIGGEAGIGKTRLSEEFASTVRWRGAVVARGRCYEPERVLPYQPIAEVLCDLSQGGDVRALPAWVQVELARIVPMLRQTLRSSGHGSAHEFGPGRQGAEGRSPYVLSDAGARQAVLFHAIVAFVRHFAARTPLLIVLEDLHWASDSTLAGLHYLTRQIANAPVLIVGAFRSEEAGEAHALTIMAGELAREGLAQHLALEPLSADAVAELVRRVRERSSSAEWVSRLYAHTEGNAFFLIETLRALDEEGGGSLPVPGTVRALIQARLSRLSASTRNFVACAAVAGRAFDFDIVCRVTSPFIPPARGGEREGEETALEAIDELLRRGFLREGTGIVGRDYEFAHSLIQQVVYAGLHHRRRRRLHRLTGETLESLYRKRREELLGTLAHHFDAAGEEEKALQYHNLTARRAESLFAWREAEEHQSRMLVLLDRLDPGCVRPDCLAQRGQVLADRAYLRFLQGRLAERDADLSALAALAEASGDESLRLQASLHRARYLNLDGQYAEAIAIAEERMTLAEQSNDISARCHFMIQVGFAHYFRGEHQAAMESLQAALTLEPSDSSVRGEVLSVLSYACYLIADFQRSLDYRQQALAIRSESGALDRKALDLTDMGILYTRLNRLPEAEQYLLDALALAQKIGSQVAESYALNNLGSLHYLRGDYPAALEHHASSLVLQRATGSRRGEASALNNSGMALLALGNYAAAESLLRQSLAIQEEIGYQSGLAEGLAHLSRAQGALGRLDEALATATRSLAVARRIGDRYCQVTALNVLAWLQLVKGEPEAALVLASEAASLAEETGLAHGRIFGLALLGLAYLRLDNPSQAYGYTSRAMSLLQEQGCIEGPEEAVYLTHSLVLTALGRCEEAADALREAESQVKTKADRIPDPEQRRRYLDSWSIGAFPRL